MFDICLVILIGVPGSGKTTLSQTLVARLEDSKTLDKCVVIPIAYDSLIPPCLQNPHMWKEARKSVFHGVHQLVNYLKNSEIGNNTPILQWIPVKEKILIKANKETKAVIIVDDNMYYRSMRYEYYQLARQNQLSFCQIYINCDLDDALKRNESRDTAVPAEVVKKIFNNLEPPDAKPNSWEKASINVPSSAITEPNVLASIMELISTALQNPVLPRKDLSELHGESQIICNTTVLHQSDLALRRLIAGEISKAKQLGNKNTELSAKAASLGQVRKKLLSDIRMGKHVIPTEVIIAMEQHKPNAQCKLSDFLSKLFPVLINEENSV